MILHNGRRVLATCLLAVSLLVTACAPEAPSRWEQAQQESTQQVKSQTQTRQTNVAGNPLPGSAFNQFFPAPTEDYERVYTQEKTGFAEAKLKRDGKDVAMLSISDTANNPDAATKYKESSQKIAGYPAANTGSTATGVLVGDRFQVKVLSRDSAFGQSDREAWLQRFDLQGLSRLN